MIDRTPLKELDPEIYAVLQAEKRRQENTIGLIASENSASPAVMEALGSVLTNKYAEGYPGHRYYGGCENVDQAEALAQARACELFGAEHANVQPHSGAQANLAVYYALLEPGDTVLGMELDHGGHLTHGGKMNLSGRYFHFVSYGVRPETEEIDYEEVRKKALREKPKLIVAGASAYPRVIDFAAFRAIADEVGARLMVDMAHIAGLVAAGVHPSPVPYADVVTTTTHKTLRGPRGGLILSTNELAHAIDHAVFPGTQGGPLMHVIAAKAVALREALQPAFRDDQEQTVRNAQVLGDELTSYGLRLVSGGTDNHLLLADVSAVGQDGAAAEETLAEAGIVVNKNLIPFDRGTSSHPSGIRLGTPEVTARGMKEEQMRLLGTLIGDALTGGNEGRSRARKSAAELAGAFPIYD